MDIESKIADLSFESSIVPMKYKPYENSQKMWVFGTDSQSGFSYILTLIGQFFVAELVNVKISVDWCEILSKPLAAPEVLRELQMNHWLKSKRFRPLPFIELHSVLNSYFSLLSLRCVS